VTMELQCDVWMRTAGLVCSPASSFAKPCRRGYKTRASGKTGRPLSPDDSVM
jgi:hypothetical protein